MIHSIQNNHLTVSVNDHGAELWSIKDSSGKEYLWQGDAAYWDDRSPNLFPYIGRMINKEYTYNGKQYPMAIHGIALYSDMVLEAKTDSQLIFRLESNEKTRTQYPWDFTYRVIYTIDGLRLKITFEVTNRSDSTMLFAVGGHPGFYIPQADFEKYRLRFSEPCNPQRIVFTSDCFVEDYTLPYDLMEGSIIPLTHGLFDEDAIVLKDSAKTVTLESVDQSHSISVSFPQMDYIGFWHAPHKDCPYVCIEPWSSLPSPKGACTVLEKQQDLLTLENGNTYENTWSITIH